MIFKLLVFTMGISLLFLSHLAPALDYSLDYGATGISGISWESSDYHIVDLVNDLGISQESQSSASYSIVPVIGMGEEVTAARNWMLYN